MQYQIQITIGGKIFSCQAVEVENPCPLLIGWDIIKQGNLPEIPTKIVGNIVHFLSIIPKLKRELVLVLGQDTTEIERLRVIQNQLKPLRYSGIIVKEYPDIDIQSVEEKVNMLASLCRFVICENSVASGHIDELKICRDNRFVTAILQERGKGATWMQADYPIDYPFMKVFEYPDPASMPLYVMKAVEWAEKKQTKRKKMFDNLYTWRK